MHLRRLFQVAPVLGLLIAFVGTSIDIGTAHAQARPCKTLKGRTYKVKIDSAPQQAAIYLEDKSCGLLGYTPFTGKLPSGTYNVVVIKKGYATTTRSFRVKRTRRLQETYLAMERQEEPGKIEVRADADRNAFGAQVWIDGQSRGTVPLIEAVKPGRHQVGVKKKDFEDFTQWVDVTEGGTVLVNPVLSSLAKPGSILVNADVNGAEIYLDGNKLKETTPAMITDVAEGPHVLEVRKPPSLPWRQTVQVVAGQTAKVTAELKATQGGAAGNIEVISNVKDASVWLDGKVVGKAPMTIKAVKPGEHIVEVKAPGYETREERVTVAAGKGMVLKLDLRSGAEGAIKIVSPVPEAIVYVDGKKLGFVPQETGVSAGEHFVVVEKEGFAKFEEKVVVKAGETLTVSAQLRKAGGIRFLSNPSGAEILLDGEVVGKTPMVSEVIDAGEHIVTYRLEDFYDAEQPVNVKAGELQIVRGELQRIDTGPTEGEVKRRQKGLTAYGARVIPKGSSAIGFGIGYPYFVEGSITVGAGDLAGKYGFDAGVTVRSFLQRTELGITGRVTFVDQNPFSVGAFAVVGGGSGVFDQSRRSTVFAETGGAVSLTGLGAVTLTGRMYFQLWSDRFCPEKRNGSFDGDPISVCEEFDNGTISAEDMATLRDILGEDGSPLDRDNGARVMGSLLAEIAVRQRWNLWLLFEGSLLPIRKERAAFNDLFHSIQLDRDPGSYFRMGATWKF